MIIVAVGLAIVGAHAAAPGERIDPAAGCGGPYPRAEERVVALIESDRPSMG
jgi:hypothetical protein